MKNVVETFLKLAGTFLACVAVLAFFKSASLWKEQYEAGTAVLAGSFVTLGFSAACFWAAEVLETLKDIADMMEDRK